MEDSGWQWREKTCIDKVVKDDWTVFGSHMAETDIPGSGKVRGDVFFGRLGLGRAGAGKDPSLSRPSLSPSLPPKPLSVRATRLRYWARAAEEWDREGTAFHQKESE